MANKNIKMNNFLTSVERNPDKDRLNANTNNKKDNTIFPYLVYGQFRNRIIADEWKYLDKIRGYNLVYFKDEEYKKLCEEITGKIVSAFREIKEELEAKYKNYNEEQFRDFINGNEDENANSYYYTLKPFPK